MSIEEMHQQGMNHTMIAAKLGVSRKTVSRYLRGREKKPVYGPRPTRPSMLDPYRHYLQERIQTYPELSAVRLLDEIRQRGYRGSVTILKDYLITLRPKAIPIEIRFETEPGEQAQFDYGEERTSFGRVHVLALTLGWSRYLWCGYGFQQDLLTLLSQLDQGLPHLGGVPQTLLFDNAKATVLHHPFRADAEFHPEFLRFARHCGFRPLACQVRRPQTKGKVERTIGYLHDSFFYARQFRDLDDLNVQCADWRDRVANRRMHGTTGEIPQERWEEEKSLLGSLPDGPYLPLAAFSRRLSRDGFLSFHGNFYSVPEGVHSRLLEVRPTLRELAVYQKGRLLVTHPLSFRRGEWVIAPEHRQRQSMRQVSAEEREDKPAGPSPSDPVDRFLPAWSSVRVPVRSLDEYERVLR
ncbi:MAG: IS21 family transposase [Coprothermobacterota bacterium]|nr:IS21 family transposase [Coprothermobacterota bacterium]